MSEFHFPWLELAIFLPVSSTLLVRPRRNPEVARRRCLIALGMTLFCALGAWFDFATLDGFDAHDRWDILARAFDEPPFTLDALSAPLLPLASLLCLLTALATQRTKARRFSFDWLLISESILLATLSCKHSWGIIGLLAAGTIPPWIELRARGKPTRVYLSHMVLFVVLLIAGQSLVNVARDSRGLSTVAFSLLMAAVLVRSGVVPMHCWMTDLFEHATFGTALLFVTPMVGAYAAVRLVLPIAPDWALHAITILSMITAIYAAGMALVQQEARRFFCYLFLSHSSLVFAGLETATPVSLTGALCVWLSVGLSLAGFGLTLRSIEARTGRLTLDEFHGLFEHTPQLAVLFLVTGLASIGFPGTFGFVGMELLVDGAVQLNALVGIAVVIASALNGLAVLHAYFRVFTGTRHVASINLQILPAERVAVLILTALILGGGLYPQPNVTSRYNAATQLINQRNERLAEPGQPLTPDALGANLVEDAFSPARHP